MEKEEFRKWNELMFKKYGNVRLYRHPNPLIRYIEGMRVRIILDSVRGAAKVVDVGCGEGYILRQVRADEAVGVDISETALKEASAITNAALVKAHAESIPFPDGHFDAAICSEVLEHTTDPRAVVKELARIVKAGGTIAISVPNEPLINRIKDMVWSLGLFGLVFPGVPRRQDDEWHLHSFDRRMLDAACAGLLKIERVHSVPFFLLPVRYVAVCRNQKPPPPTPPASSGKPFQRRAPKPK
jgi:SAM-dependent methyltransferase